MMHKMTIRGAELIADYYVDKDRGVVFRKVFAPVYNLHGVSNNIYPCLMEVLNDSTLDELYGAVVKKEFGEVE